MTNNPLLTPNIYFVAYPDPEISTYLQALIQSWDTNAQVGVVGSLTDLYNSIAAVPDRATVISELLWDGQDASDVLLSLALSYPRVSFIMATNHDTSQLLPRYFPIPYVQGIERTDQILSITSSLTEDLRGTQMGPYHLLDFAGQNYLGRNYFAHQPLIRRDVHLTLLPLLATEDEKNEFRAIAASRARDIHPQIYAIYEESEADGRPFLAKEPVTAPCLLQLSLQETTFDSRLIAKILTATSSVLLHLHGKQLPYQPIRNSHITISREGVIKMLNRALSSDAPMPDPLDEIAELSGIVREFCPRTEPLDPRLDALLTAMQAGETDLATVQSTANTVDLDLAPVKYVPQRQQAIKAAQEVKKARKNFWIYAAIGAGGLISFLIFFILYLLAEFAPTPGTDFRKQCHIPAGKVYAGETMLEVGEFYMDEHEVTIGQYEKFLKTVKSSDIPKLLPPGYSEPKSNFEPMDWKGIQKALKPGLGKRLYLGGVLTRDTPIFNVDYADAYAYAKWKGKRLPNEMEWQRAAAGDKNFKYPWGDEAEPSYANTGLDSPAIRAAKGKKPPVPGSLDGFGTFAPVNAHPKDRSPYGVLNMAGNVSEWVESSVEFGALKNGCKCIRGGNFTTPMLIPNKFRQLNPVYITLPGLGFRCVSDKPVE